MDYTILDSAGNALASFHDDELTARAALYAMVAVEPDAAEEVVLLAYDEEGLPVGPALTFAECAPPVTIHGPGVVQPQVAISVLRGLLRSGSLNVESTFPRGTEIHLGEATPA